MHARDINACTYHMIRALYFRKCSIFSVCTWKLSISNSTEYLYADWIYTLASKLSIFLPKLCSSLPKPTFLCINYAFCETRLKLLFQKACMIFWDQSLTMKFHRRPGAWVTRTYLMLEDYDAFITFMKIIFPVVTYLTSSFYELLIWTADINRTGRNFPLCCSYGTSLTKNLFTSCITTSSTSSTRK